MKICKVTGAEFRPYGKIITGYDNTSITDTLKAKTPLPDGVEYVASEPELEKLPVFALLAENQYGGMPVQLGWCNGHNTKLNCLEYHRDSEVNLGSEDFILLVAKQDEIKDGLLDTGNVKAFLCPAGVMVEVYATTLHYAPCSSKKGAGFHTMVLLPRGTNDEKPRIKLLNAEDKTLRARNKWLLAHKESVEAADGAVVGLSGINIDIANDIE
jgi:hypothetical protein